MTGLMREELHMVAKITATVFLLSGTVGLIVGIDSVHRGMVGDAIVGISLAALLIFSAYVFGRSKVQTDGIPNHDHESCLIKGAGSSKRVQ